MDVIVVLLGITAILLFVIGFLLGRAYNHLKRVEIHRITDKSQELESHIHDLRYKLEELERQKDVMKHEKEERLKKWMDTTNRFERRVRPLKKK